MYHPHLRSLPRELPPRHPSPSPASHGTPQSLPSEDGMWRPQRQGSPDGCVSSWPQSKCQEQEELAFLTPQKGEGQGLECGRGRLAMYLNTSSMTLRKSFEFPPSQSEGVVWVRCSLRFLLVHSLWPRVIPAWDHWCTISLYVVPK